MALINVRVRVNFPIVFVVSTVLWVWIVAAGAAGKGCRVICEEFEQNGLN